MSARFRPSPALIVATLALVVATGGTAFAVTAINGSSITDHTVAGRKLVNNTLGGAQILESSLGTVHGANNATTVNGFTVRKVFYAPAAVTVTKTTLVKLGGLTIKGGCVDGGGALGMVQILATTAFTHAHLSATMWNSGGSGQSDGLHVPDFSGQTVDLTDGNDWGEVSFTYVRPGGAIVNGQLAFDDTENIFGNVFNHTRQCLITGFVMSTASS